MVVSISRGLGAVAPHARGLSSFSRRSLIVSNEHRGVSSRNATSRRTLSTPPRTSLFSLKPTTLITHHRLIQTPLPRTTTATTTTLRHSSTTSTEPQEEDGSQPYWNPHKAKRHWPPDMSKLSEKQQFRIERKYRRRAKLKYARPRWMKATKLAQWGAIAFTLIYAVLILEWDENDPRGNPFENVRKYVFDSANSVFSQPTSGRKGAETSQTSTTGS